MIKPKVEIVSTAALAGYEKIECALSCIFSAVFDEPCRLIYQAKLPEFQHDLSWLVCHHESDVELGFRIVTGAGQTSRTEYYSQLVRLANFFAQSRPVCLSVVPSWTCLPSYQHEFEIRTETGVSGRAHVACTREELLPALLAEHSDFPMRIFDPVIRCALAAPLKEELVRRQFTIRADIHMLSSAGAPFLDARMSRNGEKIQLFIEKKGESMSEEETPLCTVSLSLGVLELTLNDLMQLRPGMCIEFEAPEAFEGMLVVNGAPWLEAEIKLEDRQLKITVQSTASLEIPRSSSSVEETSEQNLRLVG